jgi:hypothetical protein
VLPVPDKRSSLPGPHTETVVRTLLEDQVVDRLHSAGTLLILAKRSEIGTVRLEAACQRAVNFGEYSYRTVGGILDRHLESEVGVEVAMKQGVQPDAVLSLQVAVVTFTPTGPGPIRPITTANFRGEGEVAQSGHSLHTSSTTTPRSSPGLFLPDPVVSQASLFAWPQPRSFQEYLNLSDQ